MFTTNFTIRANRGKFSILDKQYQRFLKALDFEDDYTYWKWEVYNNIVKELLSLGHTVLFDELKYRLTGGEEVNYVFMDILSKVEYMTNDLDRLYREVISFQDTDDYYRYMG